MDLGSPDQELMCVKAMEFKCGPNALVLLMNALWFVSIIALPLHDTIGPGSCKQGLLSETDLQEQKALNLSTSGELGQKRRVTSETSELVLGPSTRFPVTPRSFWGLIIFGVNK